MTEVFVVAGASGRVGRPVAERLLSAGHEVRVVGRNARTLARLADQGAQVRVGSFQDHDFFKTALRGATAAFVLTPLDTSSPDLNAGQRKNVESIATSSEYRMRAPKFASVHSFRNVCRVGAVSQYCDGFF